MREIRIAKNAGFCFGVKRAVEMAENIEKAEESSTYTLGPLIHNDDVIESLKEQNIYPINMESLGQIEESESIVIRSHGVSAQTKKDLLDRELNVVDATCPYVLSIHRKVATCYESGYQIIIVGDSDHPEVIGINGHCDNTAIVTKNGEDLAELPSKVCVVAQTTERLEVYNKVVEIVNEKAEEVQSYNTICSATRERQDSAEELSKEVDLMIVIGGKKSSNSRKLYEISKVNCKNTIFIENKTEIPVELLEDKDVTIIGVTAGASTPDWIINSIIDKIKDYN